MKYIILITMLFLLVSCGEEEKQPVTDLCKNKTCGEWEQCNKTNGVCEAKDGFCSQNGDCTGLNVFCDETTHTCKEQNLCENVTCDEWKQCNSTNGLCELKEGRCSVNGDCLGENVYCDLTVHNCKEKESPCDGINCGGANAGNCGIVNNAPKCICNDGYFKKTEFECVEDTCINRSVIGHDKETATPFDSSYFQKNEYNIYTTQQKLCPDSQDVYLITSDNIVINLNGNYLIVEVYKEEIDINHFVLVKDYNSAMENTKILINNPQRENYYLVIKNNDNFTRDYSVYYDEACNLCGEGLDCVQNECYDICESNDECSTGFKCDETTHQCTLITCEDDSQCGDYYNPGYCINQRCVGTVECNENSDCNYLNYDDVEFMCFYNNCIPIYSISFGETIERKSFGNTYSYYYKIKDIVNIFDFDVTVNLTLNQRYYIGLYFFNNMSIFDRTVISGLYSFNQNILHGKFVSYARNQDLILELYASCENCESNILELKIGNNNNSGCISDNDCSQQSEGIDYKRSVCDLTTHTCISKQEENISELGEYCDTDSNCIGDNVFCFDFCQQKECSDTTQCEPLSDGTQMYCTDRYNFNRCREYCQSDLDCYFINSYFDEYCDLTTNTCLLMGEQ